MAGDVEDRGDSGRIPTGNGAGEYKKTALRFGEGSSRGERGTFWEKVPLSPLHTP